MLLFFTKALAASETALCLEIAGYTSETVHHAIRGKAYKTLHVFLTAPLSAGTANINAYKNGVTAGNVVLNPQQHRCTGTLSLPVEAGDRIEVMVTTTADFAPTTEDLLALIQ